MLATFVLFLREGLEASLIVSILFAALRQLGQMHHARAIWTGVILAIVGSFIGGLIFFVTVREYADTTYSTIFETFAYLIAVILLTTMTFWMQRHSRTMKQELVAKASSASSGFAFGMLAFTSVGREGLESAFFTLAYAFQTNAVLLLSGAALGIFAAIGLCFLIYRLGYRLDYRLFFRVMGILLLFFAAGLLGNAVSSMQELGWIPFGTTTIWNTSSILSQESQLGDLLHGILGYADAPTILQMTLYLAFLLIVGGIFIWISRKPDVGRPSRKDSLSTTMTSRA